MYYTTVITLLRFHLSHGGICFVSYHECKSHPVVLSSLIRDIFSTRSPAVADSNLIISLQRGTFTLSRWGLWTAIQSSIYRCQN